MKERLLALKNSKSCAEKILIKVSQNRVLLSKFDIELTRFMDAYKTTHKSKCNSADPFNLVTDPTIYLGTGGTVVALQKVSQLLKHEEDIKTGGENIEDTNAPDDEETKEERPKVVYNYNTIVEKY